MKSTEVTVVENCSSCVELVAQFVGKNPIRTADFKKGRHLLFFEIRILREKGILGFLKKPNAAVGLFRKEEENEAPEFAECISAFFDRDSFEECAPELDAIAEQIAKV